MSFSPPPKKKIYISFHPLLGINNKQSLTFSFPKVMPVVPLLHVELSAHMDRPLGALLYQSDEGGVYLEQYSRFLP